MTNILTRVAYNVCVCVRVPVCLCACVCVRACVRAYVRACVRACVCLVNKIRYKMNIFCFFPYLLSHTNLIYIKERVPTKEYIRKCDFHSLDVPLNGFITMYVH